MKRTLAILCVIACLCALCVPAMAAGNITVSVKAPDDWSQVCLYVWETDPMESWPGTAMTKNGDWWTLEIPAGSYTNVIANNGSDAAKTADLKMDGSADCWIDAGAGVVYTDAACTTPFGGGASTTPSTGLNSLALVGTGIPGAADWTPGDPNGDMVLESEGVYTKVVGMAAGSTMTFKIAGNDMWDDNYNYGGAEAGLSVTLGTAMDLTNGGGSSDITLNVAEDCNLKFTVNLTGEVPTLLVEVTDEEPTVPSEPVTPPETGETYTVYAKVPADWKNPSIWCWNDATQNPPSQGSWPGTFVMTLGEDGWYSVEIPVGYNNVLVNGNGGTAQTNDIVGLSGQDVWINAYTDYENAVYQYEVIPEDQIGQPTTAPAIQVTDRPTNPPKADEGTQNVEGEKKDGKDWTVLLSIVGSVVIIAIAAVVIIIVKSKQKKA